MCLFEGVETGDLEYFHELWTAQTASKVHLNLHGDS